MKPVELRLSGLQSYREAQTIDFARATERGLFGIFGPTGSGKSTILDAITLALYGEVTRAPHKTQGILNHGESRLEVAYTFELSDGLRIGRYRAERRYGPGAGSSVLSRACRLTDLSEPGAPVVLADKEREMTDRVEALLGLTVDDFTRAVVLPQGRFAEFLHLRGGERRQMLQRLFDLGRFGDRLNERLKLRGEALVGRERSLAAELLGLGDASPEALARARAEAEEAARAAARAAGGRRAAEERLRERREVAALLGEEEAARGTLSRLEEEAEAIAALGASVELAERAERVRDALEATEGARAEEAQSRDGLAAADERLALAERASAEGAAALADWRAQAAERRDALEARTRALAEAATLEADLAAARPALERARQALEARRQERTALEGELGERGAAIRTLEAAEAEARRELQGLSIAPAWRARVQAAVAAERAFAGAEERLASARGQEEAGVTALRQAESAAADRAAEGRAHAAAEEAADAAITALAAAAPEGEDLLHAATDALAELRTRVAATGRAAAALREARAVRLEAEESLRLTEARNLAEGEGLARARAWAAAALTAVDQARAALEAARRRDMAGHLAASLNAGAACPVCGSLEHPRPALAESDGDALEGLAANLDRAQEEAAAAAADHAAALARQAAAAAAAHAQGIRLGEAGSREAAARAALLEAAAALPPEWPNLAADATSGAWDDAVADARLRTAADLVAVRRGRLAAWRSELENGQGRLRQVQRERAEAAERIAATAAALAGAQAAAGAAARQRAAAEADRDRTLSAFEAVADGRTPDALGAEAERIEAADARAAALQEALEGAARTLGEARAAFAARGLDLETVRGAEGQLALSLERLEGETDARAERLRGLLGDERPPAVDALERTRGEAAALEAEEGVRVQAAAAAVAALAAARLAHAEAASAHAAARRRRAGADGRLGARLGEEGFANEGALRDSVLTQTERDARRRTVEAHAEARGRALADGERLSQALAGRALAEGELEASAAAADDAAERDRAAQAQAGADARAVELLASRSIQWLEASRGLAETEAAHAICRDLQEVLRAGQFIDFVAEEHLRRIASDASARLGTLTRYRYALELDSQGGFAVRDDHNGGLRRPVQSLSGGETFLASLALALALSTQIQLRGRFPLELFFLDEGFGSLDPELLEIVVTALERLHLEHVHIGLITHVAELRSRVPTRLVVEPAEAGGRGSRLRLEVG